MGHQLFICHDIERLSPLRASILGAIKGGGYAVVRGLFDERAIQESMRTVYRYANSAHHGPSSGLTTMDVRRNTSKWSIGSRAAQDGVARFALSIYNPLFDSDRFQLHDAFRRMIELRDTLAGRQVLRDADLLPDRFNACRVLLYPAGGGFLGEHRDLRGESNLPTGMYIEVLLLLTQKGVDYRTGGAFVSFNGGRLDSEADTKRGDVVIYAASTIHGVSDIDPDVPFDATNLRGRAIAIATIYDSR